MIALAVSGFLIAMTCFSLALFIFLKAEHNQTNRLMGYFNVAIGFWGFGTGLAGIAPTSEYAIWAWRLGHLGGFSLGILFFHLAFVLAQAARPPVILTAHVFNAFCCFVTLSGLIIDRTQPLWGMHYHLGNALYLWTVLVWVGFVAIGHWRLYQASQQADGLKRTQLRYVLYATAIGFTGGISTLLPMFNIRLYPLGGFAIPVYSCVVTYAIVRHHLLDIRVVLRRTLLFSLIAIMMTAIYVGVAYVIGLPLEYYAYSGLLNALACAGIAAAVFIKQRGSSAARLFSYLTSLISFWSFFYFLWLRVENEPAQADFLLRTCMIAVVLMPPAFMHFALLLSQQPYRRWHLRFQYLLSVALVATVYSPLFSPGIERFLVFPFWPLPGPGFVLHVIQILLLVHWGLYLLWQAGSQSEGRRHIQLRWTFWGYLIGWYSGFANYLVWFRVPVPPILNAFVSFYVFAIAYAIVKHQLLDIRIVLRKSLVYSALIATITAVYLVMVLIMERSFAGFFGYRSLVATVVVAGLIALGFNPLRDRLQSLIDRALFTGTPPELAAQREQLLLEVRKGEQLKAVATLAAGLAHEIKNPLAAVKTFTEHLSTHYDDPAFRQKFQTIVGGEVERINRIVQQLLEFAKPVPPKLAPMQLAPLIDQTLDFLGQDCLARRIEIRRDYQSPGPLLGDASQLKQVVLNLFLNSLEAMNGHGGRLTVTTRQDGAELLLTISDTGAGIAPEHLAHLGEPFYTTKPQGTGLGLAVVQGILKEHGGRLALTSQVGRGTVVSLYFPPLQ